MRSCTTWLCKGMRQLKCVDIVLSAVLLRRLMSPKPNPCFLGQFLRVNSSDSAAVRYSPLIQPVMFVGSGSHSINTTADRTLLWLGWVSPVVTMTTGTWSTLGHFVNHLKSISDS